MNLYQKKARQTAIYPDQEDLGGLLYVTLGMVGEAGEIANKVKKILRDDHGFITLDRKSEILQELGDLLWYVSQVATELDTQLSAVAVANLQKLYARKSDGTLSGSGDAR